MIECKHCKTQNKDNFVYCMNCGRKLHGSSFDVKEIFRNKKILIPAALACLLLLGALLFLFAKPSGNKEPYRVSSIRHQVIESNGNVYLYEGDQQKAILEDTHVQSRKYSTDGKTVAFLEEKDDIKTLKVFYGGKVIKVSEDVSEYRLSDSGENIFYTSENDRSIHLFNCRKKKDEVVFSSEEESTVAKTFTHSPDGDKIVFRKFDEEGKETYHLYVGSKTRQLDTEDLLAVVAVSDKGEVYYCNGEGQFCVNDGNRNTVISDWVEQFSANADFTQVACIFEDEFILYKDGKVTSAPAEGIAAATSIVVPPKTQGSLYYNYDSSGEVISYIHYGIDGFEDKYYKTPENNLVYIGKNLKAKAVAENITDCILSDNGKDLYYSDYEGKVHRYDGKDALIDTGEEVCVKFYAVDDVNGVFYFQTDEGDLAYHDGKETVIVSPQKMLQCCLCKDGYFYFKDNKNIYASYKGSQPEEIGETYSSGANYSEYDYYTRDGVGFRGEEDAYFFAKNGKAVRLDTGSLEEEGEVET